MKPCSLCLPLSLYVLCNTEHESSAKSSPGVSRLASQPTTVSAGVSAAAESSGVPALCTYLTGDLSPRQLSYFKHWDKLLDMESKASEQALHHHSNQH